MKNKTLTFLLINFFFVSYSHAISLGNIEVNSALSEPFSAKIPVLNTTPADSSTIQAMLAEDYAYLNARINRQQVLNEIDLSLDMDESGGYVVSLSSNEPVNELFLELILDIGTENEKLSRQYTVLLDPVNYSKLSSSQPIAIKTKAKKRVEPKKIVKQIDKKASQDMKGSSEESHSMESSIGSESHNMKGSFEESHSMESSIGSESHDMKGSFEESHSMESSIGSESHDMKGSFEESHSMESSIGSESHDMKGSFEESHSMESSIGSESHDMKGSFEESHSMESSIGEDSHDMKSSVN